MDKITKSSLMAYALSDEGAKLLVAKTSEVNLDNLMTCQENLLKAIEFVKNPENNAAGLAAPQIGVGENWFVMKHGRDQSVVTVINPVIKGRMGSKQHVESCFSELLPARVKRSKTVTVSYTTLNGQVYCQVNETLDGLDAQVFQHEYDHLQGILIAKRGEVINKE